MPEHQDFQGQEESALLPRGSPVGDPGRKGWDLFRPLGPSLVYQAYRGRVRGAGSYILSFQSSPWVSGAMSRTGVCGPLSLGLFFCGGRHSWRCGWCGRWCRQNSDTWGRGYTHVCTRICTRGPSRPSAELLVHVTRGGPGSLHCRLSQATPEISKSKPGLSDDKRHVFTRQKNSPRFIRQRVILSDHFLGRHTV